jgi:Tol biopolymer transport system component
MSTRFAFGSSFVAGLAAAGVFLVRPLPAQSIVRVDVANDGTETYGGATAADVCDDATKVVFATSVDGLDPADVNGRDDVLLRDLAAGTTTLVSVRTNGQQGNKNSFNPRISADGRFVAFDSDATNFVVGGDFNGVTDVFLRDLTAGTTTRVSVANDGSEANGKSSLAAISGDGQRILFVSDASNLVAIDGNRASDLFLRDVAAGTTIRVSTAADGTEADRGTYGGDLSSDGQVVLMTSGATNLVPGDTNGAFDVFVHDLAAGTVVRASVDSNGGQLSWGTDRNPDDFGAALSRDGQIVVFSTLQPDLAPNDWNESSDSFLHDLATGTTTIVSVDSNGDVVAANKKGYGTYAHGVTSDGRYILLEGDAATLAANGNFDANAWDIYVRDTKLAMTTRQSNDPRGVAGDRPSFGSRMTPDALHAAFVSSASDLIDGDSTLGPCVFLVTRPLRDATADPYGDGLAGTLGVPDLSASAPLLNRPFDLTLGNSSGAWTIALLMTGTASAQIPTALGGDLLVVPIWSQLVAVPVDGFDLSTSLPPDERLAALDFYLQALELDPGAVHGVSFTAGLELRCGF